MGAKEFGQLVTDRMEELGLSQNRLASRIGELEDGRIFDATQVRMLREGRRRLDHPLVARLIQVLGLDADPAVEMQAWEAAGLWPPGLSAEDVTDLSERRAARLMAAERAALEGAAASAAGSSLEQGTTSGLYLTISPASAEPVRAA